MSSGNTGMLRSNFSNQSTGSGGSSSSGANSSSGSAMEAQKKSVNNTIILCKVGCETVQDIVQRTLEVFAMLKSMQLPNGSPQGSMNSTALRTRLQEQLLFIQKHVKQLRAVYVAVNDDCAGLEFTHIEKTSGSPMCNADTFPQSLIPYKEDTGESQRLQDIKNKREIPRHLLEESRELKEQLYLKARYMKEIIDQMRKIIWEVNTMLAMSNT